MELHDMLQITKESILKTRISTTIDTSLSIRHGNATKKMKKFSHPKGNGKTNVLMSNQGLKRKIDFEIAPTTSPTEAICFYYQEKVIGNVAA